MFARVYNRLLDLVWDVTEPLSGTCPVCAFWRGVLLGAVLAWVLR